ncbi:hypothetical protein [Candidatus Enterococcus clewellii]|uniref:Uncharacterized protein n=1 Tax=Candidatus Enterococcus clewellii TaxID=1834193 RepID=A0A242JVA4_9ENTE|nr:hypothetical protein [Enterococcus sp. 9E7_DIV0242]OTP06741.1 hypothetical protein A5888_004196 [Enterococcus sp. 9E7_DIV0242]
MVKHGDKLQSKASTAVETEKIKKVAYELADQASRLDFIKNYLDLLSARDSSKMDHDSLISLHISLFSEGAMQNMAEMLDKISRSMDASASFLLDVIED